MLYFSGLQRENKSEKSFAGIWFAYRLALFGVAIGVCFSFLRTTPDRRTGVRAKPAPQAPQSCPVCPGSRTEPRRQGNGCRFAVINVPVSTQATRYAWEQRTGNPLRLVHAHVSRLKTRTPPDWQSGGAGVRLGPRFFPIINHTPHAIFCQYAASPHLTHIVAHPTGD